MGEQELLAGIKVSDHLMRSCRDAISRSKSKQITVTGIRNTYFQRQKRSESTGYVPIDRAR